MAITQTGSVLEFSPTSENVVTVSSTITVPADADLVVVGISTYSSTNNYLSTGSMTFTKGGADTAMTNVGSADSNSFWMAGMYYMVSPDTGTNKTLKWDWAGSLNPSDPPKCSVVFFKGVDTASPVRGTGSAQAGNTPFTTGTITAASGDLIIAWVGAFGSAEGTAGTWSNLSLLSQVAIRTNADGAWATGSPSGDTTVALSTDTGWDDGGICAASFKAAAGGGSAAVSLLSGLVGGRLIGGLGG